MNTESAEPPPSPTPHEPPQPKPPEPPQPAPLPPREEIRSCLHKLLRVTLTDGRTVEGTLQCYDNHANMILSDATDITNKTRPFGRAIRLGMVLVPGNAAEKVLVWRERYADTGELVLREGEGAGFTSFDEHAVGEDSDDDITVVAEGFDGLTVGG